jgi:HEAT repeat protein
VPDGLRFTKGTELGDTRLTLTIHVTLAPSRAHADAKQVQRWLEDLDSNEFQVREKATRQLEKLGHAIGPAVRQTLKGQPSAEARRRIEYLLDRMSGIDLNTLELPKNVPVVAWEDLLDRYRKELKNSDAEVRGYAALHLVSYQADGSEVVPDLLAMLESEKNEYARRCVASAVTRLGRRAKSALPVLRQQLDDPDKNIRHAFQQAIEMIERSKSEPESDEQIKYRKTIREQIRMFTKDAGR